MPQIEWISTMDNTAWVRSMREIQAAFERTTNLIKSVGKNFSIDGVINQYVALTQTIQHNEQVIAKSKADIEELQKLSEQARGWNDFSSVKAYQADITDELNKISKLDKENERMKESVKELLGLYDSLEGKGAPQLFTSQKDYDHVQNLKKEIADLQLQLANFNGNDAEWETINAKIQQLTGEMQECEDKAAQNAAALGRAGTMAAESSTYYYELTNKIKDQKATVAELTVALQTAKEEQEKAISSGNAEDIDKTRQKVDAMSSTLHAAKQELHAMQGEQNGFAEKMRYMADSARSAGGQITDTFRNIAAVAGITFSLNEAKNFIQQVVDMRSYFQDIESSMKVFLGTKEAGEEFTQKLKDYAYYNMFEFKDLAQASQQMIAYGHDIDTIIPRIDQLSNVAVGTHGSLMELVDAYNRAKSTGAVDARGIQSWAIKGVMIKDVLKEMGEEVYGTTVTFDQLNKVLDKVTGEGGMFQNLQLSMMDNISAEIGQFEDNYNAMLNEIGEKYQDIIVGVIKFGSELIDNYKEIGKVILDLVAVYGAYRAALLTANVVEGVSIAWKKRELALSAAATPSIIAETVATTSNTASKGANTVATKLLTTAQKALNMSMLSNPYVLVGAAVGALTFSIYKLITAEDAETAARRRANEQMAEFKEELNKQKETINGYIDILHSTTATDYEKAVAWDNLKKEAAGLTEGYTQAEFAALDMETAQAKVNKVMEEANFQHVKNEVEEWDEILRKLPQGYKALNDAQKEMLKNANFPVMAHYSKGYEELIKKYVDTFRKEYEEMLAVRGAIAKEEREKAIPIEQRVQETNVGIERREEIIDFYDRALVLAKELQDAEGGMTFDAARDNFDTFIKELEEGIKEEETYIAEHPGDFKFKDLHDEKVSLLNSLRDMHKSISDNGLDQISFRLSFGEILGGLSKARENLKSFLGNLMPGLHLTNGRAEADEEEKTYSFAYLKARAKANYEAALKAVKDFEKNGKDKIGGTEYQELVQKLKNAEQGYKEFGGKIDKSGRSGRQIAKNNAQRIQDQWKYEEELTKIQREASDARREAEIAAIQDDGERERAERQWQHEKTLRDLKQQEDEIYKAIYEQRKRTWELTHKDSPYELTAQGGKGWQGVAGTLTDEEQQYFDTRYAVITSQAARENAVWARALDDRARQERQYLYDYLREYGNIQDQRAAIIKEYDEKIADESNAIQRAALEQQKQKALAELNMKELQESINWEVVFNDLDRVSTEALETLRNKLRQALQSGEVSPENAQVLSERILEAENELSKRKNVYASMIPALQDRLRITNQIKQAELDIQVAQGDAEKKQQKVIELLLAQTGMSEGALRQQFSAELAAGDIDSILSNLGVTIDETTEEGKQMAVAMADYRKALENTTALQKNRDTLNNLFKGADGNSFGKAMGDIWSNAVKGAGGGAMGVVSVVADNIQSLPELIDTIGLSNTEFGEAVGKFAEGTSHFMSAIQSLASGDFVGAVTGVIKGIQSWGSMLGIGGGNAAEINRRLAELSERNEILTSSIDRLNETMSKQSGANAIKTYEKAVQLQKELEENLQEQMRLQMAYHSAHGSFNSYWGGFTQQQLADFNRLNGLSGADAWNGDLQNLTADLAAMLMADPDMWQAINDTGKGGYGQRVAEWIEQLAEQEGKLKEQTDTLYAALTAGTTRENVFSDFLDDLYDLAGGAKDVTENIAKDWQQMVNQMVINNTVGTKMQEQLSGWYDDLAELNREYSKENSVMDDETYKQELDRLKERYEGFVEESQEDIRRLTEAGIIKPLEEAIDTLTLDDIKDGWMNMLMDMSANTEEWANDIAKIMTEQLADELIFNDEWEQKQKEWLERYKEIMGDNDLGYAEKKALIDQLKREQTEELEKARRDMEAITDMTGYDPNGTQQQSATVQAMERITVDQADELIGRMNAGQMIWEQQRALQQQIQQSMASMQIAVGGTLGSDVSTLVTLANDRNIHLNNILNACQGIRADMVTMMETLNISVKNI